MCALSEADRVRVEERLIVQVLGDHDVGHRADEGRVRAGVDRDHHSSAAAMAVSV